MRTAASAAPTAAGTPEAVNRNGRDWIRRKSITSAGPAITPPQRGERLRERRHPQVDAVLDAEQLAGAGAARAEHAERRAPRRPSAARRSARHSVGDLRAAARRRPPSRRRRRRRRGPRRRRPPPAPACCSSWSRRLWRKARSFARESRQPSRIEAWSPESATTVSPGPRIVPSAPRFAWWPVVKTSASSVPSQSASSASSSRCRSIVPFSRREPVSAGAVAVERVARAPRSTRGSAVSPR